ncbi:HAMP domain-containing histidine kinase [Candidatus Kaiserbacteria bacterium]|nr:HAMP domain-containing histidine kinase [Candidatus Kaiserbacteria bacterium]
MDTIESSRNDAVIIHLHWVAFARDIGVLIAGVLFPPLVVVMFLNNIVVGDVALAIRHILPLLGILWALVVWMTIAIVWSKYYLTLWIITDKHVVYVHQINLFIRQVASWELTSIQSVSVSAEEPFATSLDYGTVWIKTPEAGESEYIIATPIPQPAVMSESIVSRLPIASPQITEKAVPQAAVVEAPQQDTSESQVDLIRSISHEMKGHLTRSQVTFASIVAGDFGEVPERLKNIADMALADTREGVETVMDILNSANLKKGTLMIEHQTFDLLESLRQSIAKFRPEAAKKGLDLRFNDKIGSCLIEGDRAKLEHHVLRNLLDNSIHYTPKGSIEVNLTWDLTSATLSIIDTGVGISAADMSHLFTEGGKGSDSSRVNPASTGYGLYVARMVVEGHGGKIWAESDGPGHGSRFYVKLPLHP